MSGNAFDRLVYGGGQGGAAPQQSGPNRFDQLTGQNRQATTNNWDTPFYREFFDNYQRASQDGAAQKYFLNRRTGIAGFDHAGVDDQGQHQQVRAGDVFAEGRKVGNVYEQYGRATADLILSRMYVDPKTLSKTRSTDELRQVVSQQQAEQKNQWTARVTRDDYEAQVAKQKEEWGDDLDFWSPAAGAAGGAVVGAGIGTFIAPGIGTAIGAGAGAVIGGLGAWLNRDEMEELAARGEVQARMAEQRSPGGVAGGFQRLQAWSGYAGQALNPVGNLVHGLADDPLIGWGQGGDDKVAFYDQTEEGRPARNALWTAADFVGTGLGAAGQFATGVGGVTFSAQMGGQILGKTGSMVFTGGETFDERTGQYDNIFFNNTTGRFDAVAGAAGIAEVGIDVIQLGMGRGLLRSAGGMGRPGASSILGKASGTGALRAGAPEVVAGTRFTRDAAGEIATARISWTSLAPSELVQHLGARTSAILANRGQAAAMGAGDIYEAALRMQRNAKLWPGMLVNGFGESTEEGLQAILEPISHNAAVDAYDVAYSMMMGFATGAGMTAGSRARTNTVEQRREAQGQVLYAMMNGKQPPQGWWAGLSEQEKRNHLAAPKVALETARQAAEQLTKEGSRTLVKSVPALEAAYDAGQVARAKALLHANAGLDFSSVITKAESDWGDHQLVGSLNQVVKAFELKTERLRQHETMPEVLANPELATDAPDLTARTEQVLDLLYRAQARFYDPATTAQEQSVIVARVNDALADLWTPSDPTDQAQVMDARAVSLMDVRNPNDNPGSFQLMAPAISIESSRPSEPGSTRGRGDGVWQMTLGPTEAQGADFDGDKITALTSVLLDGQQWANLRTGANLIGMMRKNVSIMQRKFEEAHIEVLGASLVDPNDAVKDAAKETVANIRRELEARYGAFAQETIDTFISQLEAGNADAKTWLLQAMYDRHFSNVQELGLATLTNEWFWMNSLVQRELAEDGRRLAHALQDVTASKVQSHNVTAIPVETKQGRVIAERAATWVQTLFDTLPGSQLFRNLQALVYNEERSPQLENRPANVVEAVETLTQLYLRLNSAQVDTKLDTLRAKDDVTGRVASQLLEMVASGMGTDLMDAATVARGAKQGVLTLARMQVPLLRQDGGLGKPTTLVQELLKRSVEREEAKFRGIATPEQEAQWNVLRNASWSEAMREVFGAYTMRELAGNDGYRLGGTTTLDQAVARFANQDSFHKQLDTETWRSHASYLRRSKELGKHDGPLRVDDVTSELPYTPFQVLADLIEEEGNNLVSFNAEAKHGASPYGGRVGRKSDSTGRNIREGIAALQAALPRAARSKDAAYWRELLTEYPEYERALYDLIPADARLALLTPGPDGTSVHTPDWMFEMLTLPPEQAEWMLFRQSFLASRSAIGPMTDADGKPLTELPDSVTDRLVLLSFRLASDPNPLQLARFTEALGTSTSVDQFFRTVNTEFRGNEAAYTPWARDIEEVDPSARFGSMTASLPGAEYRTSVAEFRKKAEQFSRSIADAAARKERGRLALAKLEAALQDPGAPDSANSRLIKYVQSKIDLVRDMRAPLGPDGLVRVAATLLHSLSGSQTDKGTSQVGTTLVGAHGMLDSGQTFATPEEVQIDRLTAVDARDVVKNPTHLIDGMRLMDDDGSSVDWSGLTPASLVKYAKDPANQALLYSIVIPSVYEHVGQDRISQRFLLDPDASSLIDDDLMNQVLVGEKIHDKMVHAAMLEATAGNQEFLSYLTSALVANTSARMGVVELDRANEQALRAIPQLVDIIKHAAIYAGQRSTRTEPLYDAVTGKEIPNPTVLDEFREKLKTDRKNEMAARRWGGIDVAGEQSALLGLARSEALAMQSGDAATIDAANLMLDAADEAAAAMDPNLMATLLNKYRLPKSEKGIDWMEQTRETRALLWTEAAETGSLLSEAHWSKVVRKLWMDPAKDVDGLPLLSQKEWEELSRVLFVRQLSLRTTTAGPGLAQSEAPDLHHESLKYYDPTFAWVLDDLLSPSSPLIQAELKLQGTNTKIPATTVGHLEWLVDRSPLNPRNFGTWTEGVQVQIKEAQTRVVTAGSPQGIASGGSLPKNGEALVSVTTRNAVAVPGPELASRVTLGFSDLDSPDLVQGVVVERPGGRTDTMPLVLLDGRFALSATINGVNILTNERGYNGAGYLFTGQAKAVESGLRITNRDRLRGALLEFAQKTGISVRDLDIEVEFLHPDDQPATEEYANSLYFEGVVKDGDVMAPSLLSGWWFLAGGVDGDTSAAALQAAKKGLAALRRAKLIDLSEVGVTESAWQVDFAGMLRAKTMLLLQDGRLNQGNNKGVESESIDPGFYNSIVKTLKMRHLVRGRDAEGAPVLLSAEQVIAAQQAGPNWQEALGIVPGSEELVPLSSRAVRTMVGERGEQGLPRTRPDGTSARRDTWIPWTGRITEAHTRALPGLLGRRKDLFETTAKARGDLRVVSRAVGLDDATLNRATREMNDRLAKAAEIHELRRQAGTPEKFVAAAATALRAVGEQRGTVDLTLVDARIPTRGHNEALDDLSTKLATPRLQNLAAEEQATGWVYHHSTDPGARKQTGFGNIHGFDALANKGAYTADSKAPGDILRLVLAEFTDLEQDLGPVLERAKALGLRVVLDGDRTEAFTVAKRWLEEHGYERMDGSPHLYELDNPYKMTANVRSRQGQMTATRTLDPKAVFVGIQTMDLGNEENHGYLTNAEFGQSVIFGQNLLPLSRHGNFNQVDPHTMEALRPRISEGLAEYTAASRKMLDESKIRYNKKQIKDMEAKLERSLEKAKLLLDDGTYEPGTQFNLGDIIPLYDPTTDRLLLYRHGHQPPTAAQFAEMDAKYRGNIIYSPELDSAKTAWEGVVSRFVPTRRLGMRVELEIPISAIGDKLQFSMSGFKLITSALPERWNFQLPALQPGVEVNALYGLSDSDSKNNYAGRVDNFSTAFAYLGVDFRTEVAKTLFGKEYTPDLDNQAERLLREIHERMPKLRFEAVDELMKAEDLDATVARAWRELQVDGTWAEDLAGDALSVEQRITRAILLYLMYEGSDVSHVLSSAGLSEARMAGGTAYMREMPTLFTQVFERGMNDPLRAYAMQKLNERLPNQMRSRDGRRRLGGFIGNDFRVHVSMEDSRNNFSGYLQFAEVTSSGANPVVDLMAADRTDSQKLSESQAGMAYMTLGAISPVAKDMEKLSKQLKGEGFLSYDTVDSLFAMFRDVPAGPAVEGGYRYNRTEREAMLSDRLAAAGYQVELAKDDWTREERVQFEQRRDAQAARSTGSAADAPMVEMWIRQHAGRPAEKGSKIGFISFDEAMEFLDRIEKNRTDFVSPVFNAAVPILRESHLRRLHEGGKYELSSRIGDRSKLVTSWEDWVHASLGMSAADFQDFDEMFLPPTDGIFQTYANSGVRFTGLPLSVDPLRAEKLADPTTAELLVSISPNKRAKLSNPEVLAIQGTLEELYGGTRTGLQYTPVVPPASAVAKRQGRIWAWRKENKIGQPVANTYRDFLRYGQQFVHEGNRQAAPLRIAANMRAFLALANPLLYVGAPMEMAMQEALEQASNALLGQQTTGPGSVLLQAYTPEERRTLARIDRALGQNQQMKGMIYSEVALDQNLYNAGAIEAFTAKLARMAGRWQDPYYGTHASLVSKRYREAVTNFIQGDVELSNITPMMVAQALAANPHWARDSHPAAHRAAVNVVKEMRNTKTTTASVAFRGIVEPLSNSSRILVAWPSTFALKLPYMFANYAFGKAVQVLGLQGVDGALAAFLHGREKGALGQAGDRALAFLSGQHYELNDSNRTYDFSDVVTQVDLTQAFVKGGMTHAGLMSLGLMMGGLGLAGEDDEDRRRRLAARNQGFAYLYDPRELENDFRNMDAVYLDNVPLLSEVFRVVGEDGRGRSMAHMNWIVKQVVSPIIGMERFFNNGNPMEVLWGFEDAVGSMPLVNTMRWDEAANVYAELMEAAEKESQSGNPNSLPKSFYFAVSAVSTLERMLLESSFINSIYVGLDKYDRDPWKKPSVDALGRIKVDGMGVPQPTTMLRDYIDEETGELKQAYVQRDWFDAQVHTLTENRFTAALIGQLFTFVTGGGEGDYLRSNMPVKTRSIPKDELELAEADALVRAIWKGGLSPRDLGINPENYHMSFETREKLSVKLKNELIAEYMASGLSEPKAKQMMYKVWQGDSLNPDVPGLEHIVWGKGEFKDWIGYERSSKYYQLNTTYIMGPDGRPWATGLSRNLVQTMGGFALLQGYGEGTIGGMSIDGSLNSIDVRRGINTGMRMLERVDQSFDDNLEDPKAAGANQQQNLANSGFVNYGGNGWRNFGRRSGWSRRSGGGGGGGSSVRIQAPERQQVPYANDIQTINTTNPIIRRASIRRERIDSQKGRLKPWQ